MFEGLQSSRRKSLLAHFLLTFKVCQGLLAHFLAHFSRCRLSLSAFRLPLLRLLPFLECAKRSRQPGGRRPLPRLRARWGEILGVKAGCPTLARWRRFPPGVQTTEADSGAQLLPPRGFRSGTVGVAAACCCNLLGEWVGVGRGFLWGSDAAPGLGDLAGFALGFTRGRWQ